MRGQLSRTVLSKGYPHISDHVDRSELLHTASSRSLPEALFVQHVLHIQPEAETIPGVRSTEIQQRVRRNIKADLFYRSNCGQGARRGFACSVARVQQADRETYI